MIFADKLIALRKKAGYSQEELAQQLNVTRQSVSKWAGYYSRFRILKRYCRSANCLALPQITC